MFRLWGSWYSNRPAWTHGFNAKIGFKKYAPSPKISPKKCQKLAFQTKPAKFDTFWPLSLASMHIFQNRFLRWNHEYEPVDLNTMNPIIQRFFFLTYIGGWAIFNMDFPKEDEVGKLWNSGNSIFSYIGMTYLLGKIKGQNFCK